MDLSLAEQYYRALQLLKERFQLQGEITLEHLAGAKDLITAKEEVEDVESYWQEIVPILKQSIQRHGSDETDRRNCPSERTSDSDWTAFPNFWKRLGSDFL